MALSNIFVCVLYSRTFTHIQILVTHAPSFTTRKFYSRKYFTPCTLHFTICCKHFFPRASIVTASCLFLQMCQSLPMSSCYKSVLLFFLRHYTHFYLMIVFALNCLYFLKMHFQKWNCRIKCYTHFLKLLYPLSNCPEKNYNVLYSLKQQTPTFLYCHHKH